MRQKKNRIVQKKLKIIFWQGRKNQLIFGFPAKMSVFANFYMKLLTGKCVGLKFHINLQLKLMPQPHKNTGSQVLLIHHEILTGKRVRKHPHVRFHE